ncbi:MAG: family membership [bacterium]
MAILATIGASGVVLLLGSLWLEHRATIELPKPTGAFAVGRAIHVWTDHPRPDTLAPGAVRRELVVWIWYPADPGKPEAAADDYLPAPLRGAIERARGPLISNLLTRDLAKVTSHSTGNAQLSRQQRSYPVVIMRGGASAEVANYSTLAEDLSSHGYIVVGFDAPYRTNVVVLPDSRVIKRTMDNSPDIGSSREQADRLAKLLDAWTADVAFVTDRLEQLNASDSSGKFTGRLDMARLGVFGHSLGGATAAQFCHVDSRCKAGIDVDGALLGTVIQAGISRPFMFLLSDHGRPADSVSGRIETDIRSVYDRLPPGGRLRIAIRGANHFTFSDDGALLKSYAVRGALRAFGGLRIDARRQLAVTAFCVHSFFDEYLKDEGAPKLETLVSAYPELRVLK